MVLLKQVQGDAVLRNWDYAVKVLKPYETRGCNPLFVKATAGCKANHNCGLAEKLHNPC